MNNIDMQKAREWAEWSKPVDQEAPRTPATAAAELILSLPDTIVDGNELREVINKILENTVHGTVGHQIAEEYAALIGELIPAPSPRTLADMPLEELKTHVGGEVMVDGWANPTMLVSVIEDEGAVLARGLNQPWPFVEVRPLSDLTPVASPEQEAEDEEPVTMPRPEEVPAGEPWIVLCGDKKWVGVRSADFEYIPWSAIRIDGLDHRGISDSDITLVSRLVPETA